MKHGQNDQGYEEGSIGSLEQELSELRQEELKERIR